MENGFRWGNFFGSYSAGDEYSVIGFEIGIMDVPSMDETCKAHTFSIAIKLSHFVFAIGYILKEY